MAERTRQASDSPTVEGEHDDRVRVFQADDPEQSLSTDIVLAVAEMEGSEPTELRPLNDVIDTDSLDRLFARRQSGGENDRVSFNYHDYRVTVYRDGEILLQPRGGTDT